jgi:hypothetical protein
MKQKDITTLLVVGFISIVLSIVASKFLFATASDKQQTAEVVPSISSVF